MNSQSKAYSIILFLIWPFSAVIIGLKNFNNTFGKRILIALYAFFGFTVLSIGDLERYESEFYENGVNTFSQIMENFFSLQDSKFLYTILSFFSNLVFENHHFYFLILFLLYGYFYISTVYLFKEVKYRELEYFGIFFFFALFLFLFIRPLINNAFYTGGTFVLFMIVSYFRTNKKKYLFFIFFAPLFHFALSIYLIVPIFLLLFKRKTWYYVLFVGVTFVVGKSSVVEAMQGIAESNSSTVLESKYKNYASEEGQAYLEDRYAEGDANSNIKLRSLKLLSDSILYYLVPLGVLIIYFKRNELLITKNLILLFHIVLLFWGISNLMLNISQGARFVALFSFLSIGLFFVVYEKTKNVVSVNVFKKFILVFVPIAFLYGLMSAYASNEMFPSRFFISNFFLELASYTM